MMSALDCRHRVYLGDHAPTDALDLPFIARVSLYFRTADYHGGN